MYCLCYEEVPAGLNVIVCMDGGTKVKIHQIRIHFYVDRLFSLPQQLLSPNQFSLFLTS